VTREIDLAQRDACIPPALDMYQEKCGALGPTSLSLFNHLAQLQGIEDKELLLAELDVQEHFKSFGKEAWCAKFPAKN
jgi:hypothetical protein